MRAKLKKDIRIPLGLSEICIKEGQVVYCSDYAIKKAPQIKIEVHLTEYINIETDVPTANLEFLERVLPIELVEATKGWLGEEGLSFFRGILQKHGKINTVWMEGDIPYVVHHIDGMKVRNFMRGTDYCLDWTDHDYDDLWIPLIHKCLGMS